MLQCFAGIIWRIFLIFNSANILIVKDLFLLSVLREECVPTNSKASVKYTYYSCGGSSVAYTDVRTDNMSLIASKLDNITSRHLGNMLSTVDYSFEIYSMHTMDDNASRPTQVPTEKIFNVGKETTTNILNNSITAISGSFKHQNSNSSVVDCRTFASNVACIKKPLYIGGLFDLSGPRGETLGRSELTSAGLAIDHVNLYNVLPGYELKLLHNDTQCDPGVGMDALYDFIYRRQQILMVVGSACSEVTKTIAEIVPYWNLILVSFASSSPALSKREKYKTFFRLAPADSSQNAPRSMFITNFGWDTVATLYEIGEDYSLAFDEMGNTFEQSNITIKVTTAFRRYDDIVNNLVAIKNHDARIIIGGYSEKAARYVLCQAYKLSLYGPRYVWIITGDYVERWWELADDTGCTKDQLGEAAEGYFTIDSLNSLSEDEKSAVNISVREFLQAYDLHGGSRPISPYATSSYDTIWTIALTLKHVLNNPTHQNNEETSTDPKISLLEKFTYTSGAHMQKRFLDVMQKLEFLGISGQISFEGPDRKGISAAINQNQEGHMVRIALYEPDSKILNFFCKTCRPVVWIGGRAPRDKVVQVSKQKKILLVAFFCVSSVSMAGLLLASSFLAYNLYHRKLRFIKLSSPKLNNVAVIGCMLVYMGIIILGYDCSDVEEHYYPYMCTTRAFLFAAGFSLAFGAMFTKTYRVHQIFTRANRGLIKSKLLRDKQLLFIIGALLIADSVLFLIWGIVDPMRKHVTNLTVEVSEVDEDLLYISQITTCHSQHLDKWMGALYAYKGLLLVFGVYMAWETRNVKIPALNDSRYIGMNVYNVVIMSVLVVTLSNILSHRPTLAYVLESSFMLLSTTATLCLLFVPKIYAIMVSSGQPVIAASGIMVDTNFRRFAVDEKRDIFYRAEVQNRVYKREIVELERDIVRLEQLLELPLQPYAKLTNELLFLLPESRVDPSPTAKRRWGQERDLCNSISDAGEVCMGVSEERTDDGQNLAQGLQQLSPKPLRRRASRFSIRVATAYSKLCKMRPRFSVGNMNFKHGYDDLKGSPTSPDGYLSPEFPFGRSRSSHPLLRQEAIEEKREGNFTTSDSKQSSSDTKTCESQLSNDNYSISAHHYSSVTFHVPSDMDYLKVPSQIENIGCETKQNKDDLEIAAARRRRKFTNTLKVPEVEHCRISEADAPPLGHESSSVCRARSFIERERRNRIQKLQSDLRRIQKELQHLDELEYEVSIV